MEIAGLMTSTLAYPRFKMAFGYNILIVRINLVICECLLVLYCENLVVLCSVCCDVWFSACMKQLPRHYYIGCGPDGKLYVALILGGNIYNIFSKMSLKMCLNYDLFEHYVYMEWNVFE